MSCPKCGEKIVLRTAIAETINVQYKCTRCGHKWVGRRKVVLIDKKTKHNTSSRFNLPW